jgi:uncharacterized membrane protein YcaP (DUF421 family)
MKEDVIPFDWVRMLFTHDVPLSYVFEIVLRTVIMFLFLIFVLKLLSKRGVKQLSIFELAILIALGSATGDPMFYEDVPILYGFVVLIVVILLYRAITYFTGKSKLMEKFLEGRPVCLLRDGEIVFKEYERVGLPYDKFFAELRMKSVDHLGQVRKVYLETSGDLSIYLFNNEAVKPGLVIYPESLAASRSRIERPGKYACLYCGHVQNLVIARRHKCEVCENLRWTEAGTAHRPSE